MELIFAIVLASAALLAALDYLFHRAVVRRNQLRAEARARALVEDAERQAELRLKEIELEAREKADAAEAAFEQETRKTRADLQTTQRQLEDQERLLDRKAALVAQKQTELETREQSLSERDIPDAVSHLLGTLKAADLAIEDPPLEDVLRVMFGQSKAAKAQNGQNGAE